MQNIVKNEISIINKTISTINAKIDKKESNINIKKI